MAPNAMSWSLQTAHSLATLLRVRLTVAETATKLLTRITMTRHSLNLAHFVESGRDFLHVLGAPHIMLRYLQALHGLASRVVSA